MYALKKSGKPIFLVGFDFDGTGVPNHLTYGSLLHVLEVPVVLVKFDSIVEAQSFIRRNPKFCDEETVICKYQYAEDGMSVIFEQV